MLLFFLKVIHREWHSILILVLPESAIWFKISITEILDPLYSILSSSTVNGRTKELAIGILPTILEYAGENRKYWCF